MAMFFDYSFNLFGNKIYGAKIIIIFYLSSSINISISMISPKYHQLSQKKIDRNRVSYLAKDLERSKMAVVSMR